MSELTELAKTENVWNAVVKVFARLERDMGPGLFVLWGGYPGEKKKANKTYFLNMVASFEHGAQGGKHIFPDDLWAWLAELKPNVYQCIRIKDDSGLLNEELYSTPLSAVVPLALAGAVSRRGLATGRKLVILCDNLQEFLHYNQTANEQYLRDLALALDKQTLVTFLGASRIESWDAKFTLTEERILPLG